MEIDRAKARGASSSGAEVRGKDEILQRSLFASLVGESRAALLDLARLERLPRRFAIAEQGETAKSFLLLGSGRVKLERRHGERAVALGHRGPGQMVGETAVAGVSLATESASVIDEVEALALPLPNLRDLLGADAQLRAAMAA